MYGDTYDASVKALVKSIQTCTQMAKQVGIKEVLTDISNLALAEKQYETKTDAMHEKDAQQLLGDDDMSAPDDVIEVAVELKDQKPKTAQDMPESKTT
ncbi:MAG: hypothetical protein ACKPKO_24485, partial [Candidatus Fonsibacter sp.]